MPAVQLDDEAYDMIVKKQMDIYTRYRKRIDMLKIASISIKHGIEKVTDEDLGFII